MIWQDFRIPPRAFIRGGISSVLLLKSSLYPWTMAQSEVCAESLPRRVQNISGWIFFKAAPWPSGHFFIYLIQKCLWAQTMTDLKPGNVVLNNVIVAGFRWFLFSLYLVVFFRFFTKNMYCLCNLKKKKDQHRIWKIWW